MLTLRSVALGITSAAVAIATPLAIATAQPTPVATPATARLQTELDQAVCQNQWGRATLLIGQLIASPDVTPIYREQLTLYRRQIETWQAQNYMNLGIAGCDLVLGTRPAVRRPAVPPAELAVAQQHNRSGFDWNQEVMAMNRRIDGEEFSDGPLILSSPNTSPLFSAAAAIATSQGRGQVNGSVSNGHQLYRFSAAAGDTVNIEVNVTEVRAGSGFTDSDSQLFLFNAQGQLLAENDDFNGLESALMGVPIPATGDYFVAVTTFNNDPILDSFGRVTGWPDNGSSNIAYTLTVSGISGNVASR